MIREKLKKRVLVLDGALGTMIQSYELGEDDFRGERFRGSEVDLKGCNDVLVLTRGDIIEQIHTSYIEAGADIISTNSFNATEISLRDYGLEKLVYEINYQAARIACEARDRSSREVFVAGSVGPTNRTASISPRVDDPAFRDITFSDLLSAYYLQISALIDGGCDLILIETIFDTLNAKAAVAAHEKVSLDRNCEIPLMVSVTIDGAGRTLSGQTLEAFAHSLCHGQNLVSIGLNCSFGAELLYPYVRRLAQEMPHLNISVHPNAGLPDIFGKYSHTPEVMACYMKQFLEDGIVNIIGGCCGTTPEHIALFGSLAQNYTPRKLTEPEPVLTLTGLEPLRIDSNIGFVNIGERANVAGSAKFRRLISEQRYDQALEIVKDQIAAGASVIDVCMDAAMIDSQKEICHFLNLLASEPDIAALPIMVDSSKWDTLCAALECLQGKAIVNSISLKDGGETFIQRAKHIQSMGAAAVVMLFDEQGQADSYDRKCQVAKRSYDLLIGAGFPAQDIIFDPNVLTVATGIEEHRRYGVDFIDAVRYIKENLPQAKVSGGISNFSFAFRGNNLVREAMHAAFLYHAIAAGLDMAIVNAGALVLYEDIDKQLLEAIEDVIFDRDAQATERLVDLATTIKSSDIADSAHHSTRELWRDEPLEERIAYSLSHGITQYIQEDVLCASEQYGSAVMVIEGPLMSGMKRVGELFAQGKMFLPQVVKSARVMKRAVEALAPQLEKIKGVSSDKVVIATVKGDVHDIGKNIVSIVLACNGFEVIDLGVMTPAQTIVEAVEEHKPSLLLLSGLITPSLDEMRAVIELLEHKGLNVDLLVGGATTSKLHTAVKLAPLYSGLVAQTSDASTCAKLSVDLTSSDRNSVVEAIKNQQQSLRDKHLREEQQKSQLTPEQAYQNRAKLDFSKVTYPKNVGEKIYDSLDLDQVRELINWKSFYAGWQIKRSARVDADHPQSNEQIRQLHSDAIATLDKISPKITIRAISAIYNATSQKDTITIGEATNSLEIKTPRQLHQKGKGEPNLSLSDFIAPDGDHLGVISLSVFGVAEIAEQYRAKGDDYNAIMVTLLGDRLAEAAAEYLHFLMRTQQWGYSNESFDKERLLGGKYQGIRPAFGYSSLPDHTQKKSLFDFMQIQKRVGTQLTESCAMIPQASVCAILFAHPDAKYFITE
ncbi:MAG: methionine synthase [Rikenellaceae bacterium]